MRVLLLRPVPRNERFGLGPFFRIEPLGMEYIAAALEARGDDVRLADLRFSGSLASVIGQARPDLVGIAAMHALETDEVLDSPRECARRRRLPRLSWGATRQPPTRHPSSPATSTPSCSTTVSARFRASRRRCSRNSRSGKSRPRTPAATAR